VRARRGRARDAATARRDARHAARVIRGRAIIRVDANSRQWFQAE
jgi:hypothetical protein